MPITTIFPIFQCCLRKPSGAESEKLLKQQFKLPKEQHRLVKHEDEALERALHLGDFTYEGTDCLNDAKRCHEAVVAEF